MRYPSHQEQIPHRSKGTLLSSSRHNRCTSTSWLNYLPAADSTQHWAHNESSRQTQVPAAAAFLVCGSVANLFADIQSCQFQLRRCSSDAPQVRSVNLQSRASQFASTLARLVYSYDSTESTSHEGGVKCNKGALLSTQNQQGQLDVQQLLRINRNQ